MAHRGLATVTCLVACKSPGGMADFFECEVPTGGGAAAGRARSEGGGSRGTVPRLLRGRGPGVALRGPPRSRKGCPGAGGPGPRRGGRMSKQHGRGRRRPAPGAPARVEVRVRHKKFSEGELVEEVATGR